MNVTLVAPVKLVPVRTTEVPTAPEVGVNEPTHGAVNTEKTPELVPVPRALVTEMTPVLAPDGTVAVIEVFEIME